MGNFEIIEADFQQYYHLDLSKIRFRRYARLLLNLPAESRFFRKYSPLEDWNWDKEVQTQILHALDQISCQLANMFRDKGKKKAKPQELMQPEYVKKAKEKMREERRNKTRYSDVEMKAIEEFWKRRNPNATFLGDNNGK